MPESCGILSSYSADDCMSWPLRCLAVWWSSERPKCKIHVGFVISDVDFQKIKHRALREPNLCAQLLLSFENDQIEVWLSGDQILTNPTSDFGKSTSDFRFPHRGPKHIRSTASNSSWARRTSTLKRAPKIKKSVGKICNMGGLYLADGLICTFILGVQRRGHTIPLNGQHPLWKLCVPFCIPFL